MSRNGRWRLAVLFITALGLWYRMPGLFANGFQADEALFASFARTIAVWRDPLLALQPVDKPPLLFYVQALFYPPFGPVAWAARLPNFIASILLIPLTARLAWRWYGDGLAAAVTAVLLAFSPLAIQFSPTAFTDPLLTVFLMAAVLALVEERPSLSGLFFGLALATKYQALLFLPLLVGLGWRQKWGRWLASAGLAATAVLLWEAARTGTFTLWQSQVSNFGGIRLIWSWELWPRLAAWLALWRQGALVTAVLAVFGLLTWRRWRERDWLLVMFLAGYFLLHWLLAIPVWDRYLLPALPLAALLAGRLVHIGRGQVWAGWLLGLLAVGLLPGALAARDGRTPLGSFPGADQGAAEVAEFLADEPYGTVLYDHWFSWQWRYHLFDKKLFVNWFPDGDQLVRDLTVFADSGVRYLVLPDTPVGQPVLRQVQAAGFQTQTIFQTDQSPGMLLYQITR